MKSLGAVFVYLIYAAEVSNVDLALVDSDVLKLDVSVDSVCSMNLIYAIKHLQSNVLKDIF